MSDSHHSLAQSVYIDRKKSDKTYKRDLSVDNQSLWTFLCTVPGRVYIHTLLASSYITDAIEPRVTLNRINVTISYSPMSVTEISGAALRNVFFRI